jgi:hypothetical protein
VKTVVVTKQNQIGKQKRVLIAIAVTAIVLGLPFSTSAQQASDTYPVNGSSAAQESTSTNRPSEISTATTAAMPKLHCPHAADPNRRRFGCKDEHFDWEETLTNDWNGLREQSRRFGITPSASYYSALQTNATGGTHQMWGYVGQLTTAFNFEAT